MPRNPLIVAAITAGLAVGCEVGPNYSPPKVQVLNDWGESGVESTTTPATQPSRTTNGRPLVEWWTSFRDPQLDRLIDRAVKNNLDLQIATLRVRTARAERAVAAAGLFPTVDTNGTYEHARVSKNGVASAFGSSSGGSSSGGSQQPVNAGGSGQAPGAAGSAAIPGSQLGEFDLYQIGFDASWELDIFGGKRRAVEAADAAIDAATESRRDALVTLMAEVTRNYVELRAAQHRLAIAQKNLDVQQQTLALTRQQYQSGVTNEFDASRAQAEVATTAAELPVLEQSVSEAIHRLGVLLGDRPTVLADELNTPQPVPPNPPDVPVGLPSELLRRRPDIRAAERQIAAATASVGVAVADLFPRFAINGSIGLQATEPGHLLDYQSRYYSFGPSVSWPLFDAGRIRGNIKISEEQQQESILTYRRTVLNALKEVEDGLVAYAKAQARAASLREAVRSNERAVRIANDLYKQGLSDFLNVLDAERSLYASEDSLATSEGQVDTSLVALYKALGGGWQMEALLPADDSTVEIIYPKAATAAH